MFGITDALFLLRRGAPQAGNCCLSMQHDYFSDQSQAYRKYRPGYPEALYAFLLQHVPGRQLAWDCATGSGQVAESLARYFDRVHATDQSERQLSQAPKHPQITFVRSPAEHSGLQDGAADLVTVAQALHWLSFDAFYQEARRVLCEGGLIACWGYSLCTINEHLDPLIQRFYNEVIGPFWPRQRMHIENHYQNLPFPFDEITPPQLEIREQWDMDHFLGYIRTWSSTRRFTQHRGYDPVSRFYNEFHRRWGDKSRKRTVRWPLFMRVGTSGG